MAGKASIKIKTPYGRLHFPSLFEPSKLVNQPDSKEKYRATLLFPKKPENPAQHELLKNMKKTLDDLIQDALDGGKLPKKFHYPFQDGDEEKAEKYPEYAGMWFINLTSNFKPYVIDQKRDEILPEKSGIIYPGCWVHAKIHFYFYDRPSYGVTVSFESMQKVRDDEPFDVGSSVNIDADYEIIESSISDATLSEFDENTTPVETSEKEEDQMMGFGTGI